MVYYIVYGRKNNQIKIRGNRVELDEINMTILSQENILNAYSIFRNNLIYTFICSNKTIEVESIKEILKQKLPIYMIPSKILQIDTIPLQTSGKIDENALESLIKQDIIFDAYDVSRIIIDNSNSEYDDYTIEMLSIDSLETLKLIQILSENVKEKELEFYDELLKKIVTMKISEIRDFVKKWGNI